MADHPDWWPPKWSVGMTVAGPSLYGRNRNFFRWSAADPVTEYGPLPSLPLDAVGGVDGVWYKHPNWPTYGNTVARLTGAPFVVEAGTAFAADTLLRTNTAGQAIPQGTGVAIARALEAAGAAGDIVTCVWL